ncbi:glyoxalase [Oceaniovalibus sp. ACAM 378]|jgi:catechol 2,3-dioxygenase-like lactoylglutathione lyase family enzyme|uniref:glyoxalase n=1 Tax=Oceaniovalibus sp. ACAM 378 TaxID=2599923 RepID=UPI0011D9792E|nr:glyoxalase [Oceaniovalibus sp. ACAM 378]TYB87643.1 glyoxalase [Oceaniovalibus sp. ACAM 378]
MMLMSLHHVQLAMPKGGEADARAFYGGILMLQEVAKPSELVDRGGCWFEAGSVRVRLGVETPFAPAKKAHPGFMVASLSVVEDRLRDHGISFERDVVLPDVHRLLVHDPFGNRIELMARRD